MTARLLALDEQGGERFSASTPSITRERLQGRSLDEGRFAVNCANPGIVGWMTGTLFIPAPLATAGVRGGGAFALDRWFTRS